MQIDPYQWVISLPKLALACSAVKAKDDSRLSSGIDTL